MAKPKEKLMLSVEVLQKIRSKCISIQKELELVDEPFCIDSPDEIYNRDLSKRELQIAKSLDKALGHIYDANRRLDEVINENV